MTDKELLDLLNTQYKQKIFLSNDATKLYFRTLTWISLGMFAFIGVLVKEKLLPEETMTLVYCFVPLLLGAWFSGYLFIFWEHHMLRRSIDYTEKITGTLIEEKMSNIKTYLYHEDYLGVFNNAEFPFIGLSRKFPYVKKTTVKSCWVLFVIAALPGILIYIWTTQKGFNSCKDLLTCYYPNWVTEGGSLYIGVFILIPVLCIRIHFQCIKRERDFCKNKLGITE